MHFGFRDLQINRVKSNSNSAFNPDVRSPRRGSNSCNSLDPFVLWPMSIPVNLDRNRKIFTSAGTNFLSKAKVAIAVAEYEPRPGILTNLSTACGIFPSCVF